MTGSNPRNFSFPEQPKAKESGLAATAKEKAEDLASSLKDVAGSAQEKVSDLASTVANKAGDAWDSTKEGVEEFGTVVADKAESAYAEAVIFIRRYPFVSVVGALCAGMLAGQAMGLMGRRD